MGDASRIPSLGLDLTLQEPDYEGESFARLTESASGPERRRAAARALAGDEGLLTDPGELRLNVDASAFMLGSVPGAVPSELSDPTVLTAGLRPTGAGAGVSLRTTFRLDRSSAPASDAAAGQIELAALGAGEITEQGAHAVAEVVRDAMALRAVLEGSYERVAALQAWLGSSAITRLQELSALVQSGGRLDAAQIAEANQLIEGLVRELPARSREVRSLLGTGRTSVDQALDIMNRLESGADRAGASIRIRLGGEVGLGLRSPTLRFGPDDRFGVDVAARIAAIVPGQVPEELRGALQGVEDMVTLRSTMVAVRGYVAIALGAHDALRQRLNDVRGSLVGLLDTVDGAQRLLGGLASGETSGVEDTLRSLESQAVELESSAQDLMEEVQPVVTAGVEIDQANPTGGLALDEVRARIRYTDTSFEAALSLYVQHVAGILPGTRTRVTFDAQGRPRRSAPQDVNVYESLFPRLYGADLSLAIRRDTNTSTRIVTGALTDGRAVTAHLGLIQQLGSRFLVRLGLVDPDLLAGEDHTLIPTAGMQIRLGPDGNEDAFSIDLNAGTELRVTGQTPVPEGAFGLPQPLVGGSAAITFTGRFGR